MLAGSFILLELIDVTAMCYHYDRLNTNIFCQNTDWLVPHFFRYLKNPEMKFVKFYGKNYDTDSLADGIIKEIKEHK